MSETLSFLFYLFLFSTHTASLLLVVKVKVCIEAIIKIVYVLHSNLTFCAAKLRIFLKTSNIFNKKVTLHLSFFTLETNIPYYLLYISPSGSVVGDRKGRIFFRRHPPYRQMTMQVSLFVYPTDDPER